MILLPPELHAALRTNAACALAAEARGERFDPAPVVKFFNPVGSATWLASELAEDGDTLFGLADLGFGTPELGIFSLAELASVRLPFGLGIERDIAFASHFRLSVWTGWARRAGSIPLAETLLRRASRSVTGFPPDGG
ncbi:DUF2958 domain-containing protein [Pelagerythrobacter aerophilus]|uniref:DUF2958 domain-containing protein n=1 Tax=Pelagerythrobacter aerophilus TaxID=2306995 RepID=A0A418NL17_9SPHN|nr:DUF2958 domain-containing protein [Pelagerythrobacter aerophilus]RIV80329.1 DUF2958 domain-containing protein [Pelagerythrobacter aerophilus]